MTTQQLLTANQSSNVGFLQSGAGALPRTAESKLRDVVSVMDFGAVGDGVTDDTAAIQAALNNGTATQRVVWLPAGTYKISSRLVVGSHTGLASNGDATLFATAAGFNYAGGPKGTGGNNSLVIDLSGQLVAPFAPNTNQIIEGLRIISELSDGRTVDAITARNCTNVKIVGNEIANFPNTRSITLASVIGGEVSSNWIHDCATNFTGWSPLRPQITGVEIDNDRVNSVNSARLRISDNRIERLTVGAAVLAYAGYETDGVNVHKGDVVVVDNFIDTVGEGVDTFASDGVISNNIITNTYNFGIKLIHGASRNVITGNRITNTGIAGIVLSGSDVPGVTDCEGNTVTGNAIDNVDYLGAWGSGTGLSGIKIDGSGLPSVAKNNLIANNFLDGSANYGLITGQAAHKNIYAGNRIAAAPALGYFDGSETLSVSDALPTRVRTHRTATQSIPAQTATKVEFNTVGFDARGEFSTTNNRWVCQIPGVYNVTAQVRFAGGSVPLNTVLGLEIRRNNASVCVTTALANFSDQTFSIADSVFCNSGDYLEIWYYQNNTSAQNITGNSTLSFFSITSAQ